MTKIEALTDLLAKVKAGEWDHRPNAAARVVFPYQSASADDLGLTARSAFDGSLDAAMALHEAVLPGFFWQRQGFVMIVTNDHTGWGNGIYGIARDDTNPARAWLIAILKALIEMEGKNDDQ